MSRFELYLEQAQDYPGVHEVIKYLAGKYNIPAKDFERDSGYKFNDRVHVKKEKLPRSLNLTGNKVKDMELDLQKRFQFYIKDDRSRRLAMYIDEGDLVITINMPAEPGTRYTGD